MFKKKRVYLKNFYILIAILTNIILWQNCVPNFSASNNIGLEASSINPDSGASGTGTTPSKLSFVINERKFNRSSGKFSYKCDDPNSEIPQLKPGKLTKLELTNSIKNVLGLTNINFSIYPEQSDTNKFKSSNLYKSEDTLFSSMNTIGDLVATSFIQSLEDKSNPIWDCDFSRVCTEALLKDLPTYIWRKKLNVAESNILNKIAKYEDGDSKQEIKIKLSSFVSFLVQSPQFFIKKNLPKNSVDTAKLKPIQIINRLSFFLTSSAPSIDIVNKYYHKTDLSTEQVKNIAKEILNSGQNKENFVKNYLTSYLSLSQEKLNTEMFNNNQISKFINDDINNLTQLFMNNEPLSSLISNIKAGILTNSTFSYTTNGSDVESAPIRRGTTILSNTLCQDLPSLSPATLERINEILSQTPENLNNMETLAYHRSIDNCATCHNIIDPPAIGLEVFDQFGQLRDKYSNGDKIETVGSLGKNKFNNIEEYLNIMSKSVDFKSCFANHLNSAINYSDQYDYNPCLVKSIYGDNEEIGLMDLIYQFVTSNNFLRAKKPQYINGEVN